MSGSIPIFTEESCMPNRRKFFNVEILGPHFGTVCTILGSCFGYLYKFFASRCLKWLKFSLKNHECKDVISLNFKLLGPCKGNNLSKIGPCFGHSYNIFTSRCLKWLRFSLESHACQV